MLRVINEMVMEPLTAIPVHLFLIARTVAHTARAPSRLVVICPEEDKCISFPVLPVRGGVRICPGTEVMQQFRPLKDDVKISGRDLLDDQWTPEARNHRLGEVVESGSGLAEEVHCQGPMLGLSPVCTTKSNAA